LISCAKRLLQQYRHKADNRGTATICPLLNNGHAERVLANLKTEILRRLFRSARTAQGVTAKNGYTPSHRSGPSGDNPIAERV
jgi:hypothetical protein